MADPTDDRLRLLIADDVKDHLLGGKAAAPTGREMISIAGSTASVS